MLHRHRDCARRLSVQTTTLLLQQQVRSLASLNSSVAAHAKMQICSLQRQLAPALLRIRARSLSSSRRPTTIGGRDSSSTRPESSPFYASMSRTDAAEDEHIFQSFGGVPLGSAAGALSTQGRGESNPLSSSNEIEVVDAHSFVIAEMPASKNDDSHDIHPSSIHWQGEDKEIRDAFGGQDMHPSSEIDFESVGTKNESGFRSRLMRQIGDDMQQSFVPPANPKQQLNPTYFQPQQHMQQNPYLHHHEDAAHLQQQQQQTTSQMSNTSSIMQIKQLQEQMQQIQKQIQQQLEQQLQQQQNQYRNQQLPSSSSYFQHQGSTTGQLLEHPKLKQPSHFSSGSRTPSASPSNSNPSFVNTSSLSNRFQAPSDSALNAAFQSTNTTFGGERLAGYGGDAFDYSNNKPNISADPSRELSLILRSESPMVNGKRKLDITRVWELYLQIEQMNRVHEMSLGDMELLFQVISEHFDGQGAEEYVRMHRMLSHMQVSPTTAMSVLLLGAYAHVCRSFEEFSALARRLHAQHTTMSLSGLRHVLTKLATSSHPNYASLFFRQVSSMVFPGWLRPEDVRELDGWLRRLMNHLESKKTQPTNISSNINVRSHQQQQQQQQQQRSPVQQQQQQQQQGYVLPQQPKGASKNAQPAQIQQQQSETKQLPSHISPSLPKSNPSSATSSTQSASSSSPLPTSSASTNGSYTTLGDFLNSSSSSSLPGGRSARGQFPSGSSSSKGQHPQQPLHILVQKTTVHNDDADPDEIFENQTSAKRRERLSDLTERQRTKNSASSGSPQEAPAVASNSRRTQQQQQQSVPENLKAEGKSSRAVLLSLRKENAESLPDNKTAAPSSSKSAASSVVYRKTPQQPATSISAFASSGQYGAESDSRTGSEEGLVAIPNSKNSKNNSAAMSSSKNREPIMVRRLNEVELFEFRKNTLKSLTMARDGDAAWEVYQELRAQTTQSETGKLKIPSVAFNGLLAMYLSLQQVNLQRVLMLIQDIENMGLHDDPRIVGTIIIGMVRLLRVVYARQHGKSVSWQTEEPSFNFSPFSSPTSSASSSETNSNDNEVAAAAESSDPSSASTASSSSAASSASSTSSSAVSVHLANLPPMDVLFGLASKAYLDATQADLLISSEVHPAFAAACYFMGEMNLARKVLDDGYKSGMRTLMRYESAFQAFDSTVSLYKVWSTVLDSSPPAAREEKTPSVDNAAAPRPVQFLSLNALLSDDQTSKVASSAAPSSSSTSASSTTKITKSEIEASSGATLEASGTAPNMNFLNAENESNSTQSQTEAKHEELSSDKTFSPAELSSSSSSSKNRADGSSESSSLNDTEATQSNSNNTADIITSPDEKDIAEKIKEEVSDNEEKEEEEDVYVASPVLFEFVVAGLDKTGRAREAVGIYSLANRCKVAITAAMYSATIHSYWNRMRMAQEAMEVLTAMVEAGHQPSERDRRSCSEACMALGKPQAALFILESDTTSEGMAWSRSRIALIRFKVDDVQGAKDIVKRMRAEGQPLSPALLDFLLKRSIALLDTEEFVQNLEEQVAEKMGIDMRLVEKGVNAIFRAGDHEALMRIWKWILVNESTLLNMPDWTKGHLSRIFKLMLEKEGFPSCMLKPRVPATQIVEQIVRLTTRYTWLMTSDMLHASVVALDIVNRPEMARSLIEYYREVANVKPDHNTLNIILRSSTGRL